MTSLLRALLIWVIDQKLPSRRVSSGYRRPVQLRTVYRSVQCDCALVHTQVFVAHASRAESLFETFAASAAVESAQAFDCLYRFIHAIHDESAHAVLDDLLHRTSTKRDHGRSAGHGFDHDQPEGLRPIDGKQQRRRLAQECTLAVISDFVQERHMRL